MNKVRLPRLLIGRFGKQDAERQHLPAGLLRALGDAGEKPVSFKGWAGLY